MPAAAKSSTSAAKKATGAPKAKGAVRAKSGCYTCRIRRKKCDEQPNEEGHCQTCVRLRLECLGFGAKRPDWLRESRNVVELREKIKSFLAEQGMIKGHTGAAPRGAAAVEEESSTLRLADEAYNSSGETPPSPTLALSAADGLREQGLNTSSIRDDQAHWPTPPMPSMEHYNQHHGLHPSQIPNPSGPYPQGFPQQGDLVPPTYSLPPNPVPQSSANDIVVSVPTGPAWQNNSCYPTTASSFSTTYHWNFSDHEIDFTEDDFNISPYSASLLISQPTTPLYGEPTVNELILRYITDVIKVQFLLVQDDVREMIAVTSKHHHIAAEGAQLLAHVHYHKFQGHNAFEQPQIMTQFNALARQLLEKSKLGAGDAIGALHIISSFLFNGGSGDWRPYLLLVCKFADSVLRRQCYSGPADALMRCGPDLAFIIKTAFWFDVLSSVTLRQTPFFLYHYRSMFAPYAARIEDSRVPEELSMMNVMGCENTVVWTMAEISELARWKQQQMLQGRLSVPILAQKASDIEQYLHSTPYTPSVEQMFDSTVDNHRHITSEIFRASTNLYLSSVVSGDFPDVPEISKGVQETLQCLAKIPPLHRSGVPSVIRSTVFSVFICGCLTNRPQQRVDIIQQLELQMDGVGNTGSVRELLLDVWRQQASGDTPVPWRDMLQKSMVLLV